jgi:hypothetical protein
MPDYSGTVEVWAYTDAHGIANFFESMQRIDEDGAEK